MAQQQPALLPSRPLLRASWLRTPASRLSARWRSCSPQFPFMLGQPHYGVKGEVLKINPEHKGKIQLKFTVHPEPDHRDHHRGERREGAAVRLCQQEQHRLKFNKRQKEVCGYTKRTSSITVMRGKCQCLRTCMAPSITSNVIPDQFQKYLKNVEGVIPDREARGVCWRPSVTGWCCCLGETRRRRPGP